MKQINWNLLDEVTRTSALARPAQSDSSVTRAAVARTIEDVRNRGDVALIELTRRLDRCELAELRVSEQEFDDADSMVSSELKQAIVDALARIDTFHRACAVQPISVETAPGVVCERIVRPIERVGLYVPAGGAPLPSTALMLGVPAMIAGCNKVIMCTPPRIDGSCDPAVLFAARRCGISAVFKIGGAQAIAAMAYGTESVPRCDKVFGPGNVWVTEAKIQVAADPSGAAIDMPAGPSEVLVIADAQANPQFVAADLLAQAEHGADSQSILLSPCQTLIDEAAACIDVQRLRLPRAEIAGKSLAHGSLIKVQSLAEAVEISNGYAPEHLIINTRDPRTLLDGITSAGSIFLGAWSPESVGDYCSGTNHVLPTYGAARSWSGLSVSSFQKQMTVQQLSADGLRAIGPCTVTLARAEKLDGHAAAVSIRLDAMEMAA